MYPIVVELICVKFRFCGSSICPKMLWSTALHRYKEQQYGWKGRKREAQRFRFRLNPAPFLWSLWPDWSRQGSACSVVSVECVTVTNKVTWSTLHLLFLFLNNWVTESVMDWKPAGALPIFLHPQISHQISHSWIDSWQYITNFRRGEGADDFYDNFFPHQL